MGRAKSKNRSKSAMRGIDTSGIKDAAAAEADEHSLADQPDSDLFTIGGFLLRIALHLFNCSCPAHASRIRAVFLLTHARRAIDGAASGDGKLYRGRQTTQMPWW